MDIFGRKKDNTVAVSIISSAIGATVGALATMFLVEPKNRKALSAFMSHVLETTTKKGEEVIDMTTKKLEKNGRKSSSRSSQSDEETSA